MRKDGREASHHKLISLELTGGFLENVKMEFADGLNCIIGGFGTGKTTVLEAGRHALGAIPEARKGSDRAKTLQDLMESNLKNGRVRLTLETKHGTRYVVERPAKDTAQVLNAKGEATTISFQTDNIFGAEFYSQNEILEITKNPSMQLLLIDKPIEEEVRRIEVEIRKLDRELAQSAADVMRLDREARELAETASEATVLEEKLKPLRQAAGPDAKAVNVAHARRALRDKERGALEALRTDLIRVEKDLDTTVSGIRRRLESRLDGDLAEGPNEDLLTKVRDAVLEVTHALDQTVVKVKEQCVTAGSGLERHQAVLAGRHAKEEAEYRALLAKSQEESGRAAERQQLEQRHLEVTSAKKELVLRRGELKRSQEHRHELLARLTRLRDERYALRTNVAEKLTDALKPNIRVSVIQGGGSEAYNALLHEGLRKSGLKYDVMVKRIIAGANPDELCAMVQAFDVDRLVKQVGIDAERAHKVIDSLKDTELVYRIEAVEREDVPHIELLHGHSYKDSSMLSTGQRCTAILPILLLESERPLLIDQPEDNLDNAYIYEAVVKTLTTIKKKRQLIFVTHNANIPVNGDADRVFVMEFDGQQGRLKKFGTVEECKPEIELLLEGGAEAFLLRQKRYGH